MQKDKKIKKLFILALLIILSVGCGRKSIIQQDISALQGQGIEEKTKKLEVKKSWFDGYSTVALLSTGVIILGVTIASINGKFNGPDIIGNVAFVSAALGSVTLLGKVAFNDITADKKDTAKKK
jgi:hypothetical protein